MVFDTSVLDALLERAAVKVAIRLEAMALDGGSSPPPMQQTQVASHEYLLSRWDSFYHDIKAQYQAISDYLRTAYSDPRSKTAFHALSTHGHDWGHALAGVPRRYGQEVLDDLLPLIKAISLELDAWYASAVPGKTKPFT